jgi:hypothetical protein
MGVRVTVGGWFVDLCGTGSGWAALFFQSRKSRAGALIDLHGEVIEPNAP